MCGTPQRSTRISAGWRSPATGMLSCAGPDATACCPNSKRDSAAVVRNRRMLTSIRISNTGYPTLAIEGPRGVFPAVQIILSHARIGHSLELLDQIITARKVDHVHPYLLVVSGIVDLIE